MHSSTDLTPEVRIFQHSFTMPEGAVWAMPQGSYLHSDNIHVWPMWDVGATPMFGRWIIRIDIYQPKGADQ